MRLIRKGATSQTIYVVLLDSASTTGGRKTGIAFNTASLVGNYVRNGAARTAITLATLASASAAWSSGGFVEVDATNAPGLYRLDVPDAAFASGVDSVVITLKGAAGMVGVEEEVQLTAIDLQDTVRLGLTALPNAAAEAAGGLYTRGAGAGQINQQANGQADVNVARWLNTAAATPATAGIPKVAIEAAGDFAQAAADKVWSTTTRAITDKAGFALSAAGVQAIWDALTSALVTASSIGKLLVDNVNATISSRLASASYTAPDNTSIGTILTRTDVATSTRLATSGYTAPPSAATVSTQVWTEPIPGAFAAGSAGAKLNSASAAGDPWGTAVPGAYGAGTAGNILGNRLDVAVSTRATSAGAGGAGSRQVTITVNKPDTVTPLGSCAVWVSTDLGGTNVVAGTLYTNDSTGQVTFMLDNGTYYYWRQHPAYTFANPVAITVS